MSLLLALPFLGSVFVTWRVCGSIAWWCLGDTMARNGKPLLPSPPPSLPSFLPSLLPWAAFLSRGVCAEASHSGIWGVRGRARVRREGGREGGREGRSTQSPSRCSYLITTLPYPALLPSLPPSLPHTASMISGPLNSVPLCLRVRSPSHPSFPTSVALSTTKPFPT